jgi:spore germination cell wall hydrolase CwlJ-like protein
MFHRFAVMIAGMALAAGSVAPAKVAPHAIQPTPAVASNDVSSSIPALVQNGEPLVAAPVMPAPEPQVEPASPVVSRSESLAEKVADFRSADAGSRELECLAAGIYFESKSEPLTGQLAVGEVIANRAASRGRFPSTYCGVLFQRGQFSFVRGGRWPAVNKNGQQWKTAVALARIIDQDLHDSPAAKALFFHARRVSPGWRLTRVAAVGNHIFYR